MGKAREVGRKHRTYEEKNKKRMTQKDDPGKATKGKRNRNRKGTKKREKQQKNRKKTMPPRRKEEANNIKQTRNKKAEE